MTDRETVIKKLQGALDDAENNGNIYAQIRRPVVFETIAMLEAQEDMIQIHVVADWLARYAVPPSKTSLDHAEMASAWMKFLEQFKE